jgi:hypothetical protein
MEEGRKRLNAKEAETIRAFCGIVSVFEDTLSGMEKRLKGIPGGWRDARMLASVAERLMEKVFMTVPTDQLQSLQANLKRLKMVIKLDPVSMDDDATYVPLEHMVSLVRAVQEDTCFLCSKDEIGAKKCPIRKALDAVAFVENEPVKGCRYRLADPLDILEENAGNGPTTIEI